MKKKLLTSVMSAILIISSATTSFAGRWIQEGNNWKYQNDNGKYAVNWQRIDGKSYYFDENGRMLANTTTPDGYTVNADGEWVFNGVVQIQSVNTSTIKNNDNYDPKYPLKGYMESWFVTSPVTGTTAWKSDPDNYVYEADNHSKYAFDLVIQNRDPLSFNYFGGIELAAIAKLTNYQTTGLDPNQEKLECLTAELRNFLNSFDWINASDYEKAVQIVKWITKADYLDQEGTQYPYSCLVEGKANCNGYTWSARLLATCVGLPIEELGSVSHTFPVFLVDGIWLSYEPTSKNNYFTVAEVYTPAFYLDGEPQLTPLGKYCKATGYKIPSSVEGKFSDVRNGVIQGKNAPVIYFK